MSHWEKLNVSSQERCRRHPETENRRVQITCRDSRDQNTGLTFPVSSLILWKAQQSSATFFTSLNSTCRKVHFSHSLLRRKEGSRKSGTSRGLFVRFLRVSLPFPGMKSSPVPSFQLNLPFKAQPRPFPLFLFFLLSFFPNQHFLCHRASLPFEKEFRRDLDVYPLNVCRLTYIRYNYSQ